MTIILVYNYNNKLLVPFIWGSKKVSEQLRLGGEVSKESPRLLSVYLLNFFCCSLSSHKDNGAVRSIKTFKVQINIHVFDENCYNCACPINSLSAK